MTTKIPYRRVRVALLLTLFAGAAFCAAQPFTAFAQSTAFTYQGRLNDGGSPANGIYDFRFKLFQDPLGNTQAGTAQLTNGVPVTNGLCTVTIDFGAGIFTGNNYWLEVDVKTNGAASYTDLSPLQAVTPAPYSIFANSASNLLASAKLNVTGLTIQNNSDGAPNVIGGSSVNYVSNSVVGATIGGGGAINVAGSSYTNSVTANFGTVSGGGGNTVSGWASTVGGGEHNSASSLDGSATVGGGYLNTASGDSSTVGGGAGNSASGLYATVGGGAGNSASGPASSATVGGGNYNIANGNSSTVGGGYSNKATSNNATVGGGDFNTASGGDSTVGGGANNIASGLNATVSGGGSNTNGSPYATIGGGGFNTIGTNSNSGTVSGGFANQIADNTHDSAIGGGSYGSIGTNSFASTLAGGSHNSIGSNASVAAIGGGTNNTASAFATTVSGGADNIADAWGSTVGGGAGNTASSPDGSATVSGGYHNTASGDSSTAAGGAYNTASANYATVSGGDANAIQTNANYSAIGGGELNVIQSNVFAATIGGGDNNTIQANAYSSTISGGAINTILANAHDSTICGGYHNTAAGQYSFAAGQNADARDDRSFIWSSYPNTAPTFGSDEFYVSATNGLGINCGPQRPDGGGQYWMNIGTPGSGVLIETSVGASLSLSGVWQNASDRARKTNFATVDPRVILDKLVRLPVESWRYTNEVAGVRHLGPTAQDFMAAFGLGTDDKTIGTVDEGGVALAAIQGLYRKVENRCTEMGDWIQKSEIRSQKSEARIRVLETENAELKARLDTLERLIAAKKAMRIPRAAMPIDPTASTNTHHEPEIPKARPRVEIAGALNPPFSAPSQ